LALNKNLILYNEINMLWTKMTWNNGSISQGSVSYWLLKNAGSHFKSCNLNRDGSIVWVAIISLNAFPALLSHGVYHVYQSVDIFVIGYSTSLQGVITDHPGGLQLQMSRYSPPKLMPEVLNRIEIWGLTQETFHTKIWYM